jgi:hypothetical protein
LAHPDKFQLLERLTLEDRLIPGVQVLIKPKERRKEMKVIVAIIFCSSPIKSLTLYVYRKRGGTGNHVISQIHEHKSHIFSHM